MPDLLRGAEAEGLAGARRNSSTPGPRSTSPAGRSEGSTPTGCSTSWRSPRSPSTSWGASARTTATSPPTRSTTSPSSTTPCPSTSGSTPSTAVAALDRNDRWYALARLSLRDELYSSLRAITLDVLADTLPEESADEKIAHWEQANASRLTRARSSLTEIARLGRADLATVSVAARQIRSMVR